MRPSDSVPCIDRARSRYFFAQRLLPITPSRIETQSESARTHEPKAQIDDRNGPINARIVRTAGFGVGVIARDEALPSERSQTILVWRMACPDLWIPSKNGMWVEFSGTLPPDTYACILDVHRHLP